MSSSAKLARGAPAPGHVLAGKYIVEEVIGVGGMGVVVAAKHAQLDQQVAIKYLLPDALRNPEVIERFAREARAAAKIRGEHVARIIDVGQFEDGAPYMVMEHLTGHDLARQLTLHGPLPVADAVRYILETCEALAEAHVAKIVHRDLKPSNLFLATQPDRSVIVKVLDFGISKVDDAASAALTKTSALMGTAYYMSPEQLTTPKAVDHRSDIWAFGVILYELLSGQQPFAGESVPEIIAGILSNRPPALRTLRGDVPIGLDEVIAQCMHSKAHKRYQSVAELARALSPFAHARDRFSIGITSRVLGESGTAPTTDTSVANGPAQSLATAPRADADVAPGPMPPLVGTHPASVPRAPRDVTAILSVTPHRSPSTPSPTVVKRSPLPFLAVAVGVLIIGATALGLLVSRARARRDDGPLLPAYGLVVPTSRDTASSAAPSVATGTSPLPGASSATSAKSEPSPPTITAPSALLGSPRVPGPPLAGQPVKTAGAGAGATQTPTNATDGGRMQAAADVGNASSSASSPPLPRASASAKPNPMQMGLK